MVDEGYDILVGRGNLLRFGELLDRAWRLKRELDTVVSNDTIDQMYRAGREAGAVGGKLLGAGGGGFLLFFVPPERQAAVRKRLAHLLEVEFKLGRPRLQRRVLPCLADQPCRPVVLESRMTKKLIASREEGDRSMFSDCAVSANHAEQPKNGPVPSGSWTTPVVILAGGLGTRLRSVLADRPKGLAAIGSQRFLEIQIELLRNQGERHFVLCVGHMAESIEQHLGNGRRFGVRIAYSTEGSQRLGTGGALRLARRFFAPRALVLNGDTFFDLDYSGLVQFHEGSVPGDRLLGDAGPGACRRRRPLR